MTVSPLETSVVVSDKEVVSCDLAGGRALLDLRTGTYFSLNEAGAFIWELLRSPIAVSDIHNALVAHYHVERSKCYNDLIKLLQELAEAGLIVTIDATTC